MQNTPHDGGQHDADGALDAQGKGKQPTAKPLTVDDLRDALLGKNAPKDDRPDAVVLRELREGVKAVSITLKPPATLLAQTDYEHDRSKLMRSHREALDKVSRQLNWGINRFSSQLPEARKKCNERPWKIDFHIQSAVPHLPLIYEKTGVETLAILITVYWSTMAKSVNDCETEKDRENWRYWFMDVLIGMCNAQVDRCIQAATEEVEELEKWLDARNLEYEQLPVPVLTHASDTSAVTRPGLLGPSGGKMPQGVPPLEPVPHTQSFPPITQGGQGDIAPAVDAPRSENLSIEETIKQLSRLQENGYWELVLFFNQDVDANGKPTGELRVEINRLALGFVITSQSADWSKHNWPHPDLVTIWRSSAGHFGPSALRTDTTDLGLSQFLFEHSQTLADHSGIKAMVSDPLQVWIAALGQASQQSLGTPSLPELVEPDPDRGSVPDVQRVAARALSVRSSFADFVEYLKNSEASVKEAHKRIEEEAQRGRSKDDVTAALRELQAYRQWYEMSIRELRRLQQDLQLVEHYARTLIPETLLECREFCTGLWCTFRPSIDQEALKKDLDRIAIALKNLRPKRAESAESVALSIPALSNDSEMVHPAGTVDAKQLMIVLQEARRRAADLSSLGWAAEMQGPLRGACFEVGLRAPFVVDSEPTTGQQVLWLTDPWSLKRRPLQLSEVDKVDVQLELMSCIDAWLSWIGNHSLPNLSPRQKLTFRAERLRDDVRRNPTVVTTTRYQLELAFLSGQMHEVVHGNVPALPLEVSYRVRHRISNCPQVAVVPTPDVGVDQAAISAKRWLDDAIGVLAAAETNFSAEPTGSNNVVPPDNTGDVVKRHESDQKESEALNGAGDSMSAIDKASDSRDGGPIETQPPKLSPRHIRCLEAHRDLKALCDQTRKTANQIARHIDPHSDETANKEEMAELARRGLIDTKRGRPQKHSSGGSFITKEGLKCLPKVPRKRRVKGN